MITKSQALGKPVHVYVGVPENHGGRPHRWNTASDRFLLYHPSVKVYTEGEYDKFIEQLKLINTKTQ